MHRKKKLITVRVCRKLSGAILSNWQPVPICVTRKRNAGSFDDCKLHFEHIRETVNDTFHAAGYELDKTDAVLEPSYICEALGLQGRLDYMQRDMSSFIEMKSGKADEYAIRGKVEPKENNKVQMLLYQQSCNILWEWTTGK